MVRILPELLLYEMPDRVDLPKAITSISSYIVRYIGGQGDP